MYCTSCGTQLQDTANYCSECGRQTARAERPSRDTLRGGSIGWLTTRSGPVFAPALPGTWMSTSRSSGSRSSRRSSVAAAWSCWPTSWRVSSCRSITGCPGPRFHRSPRHHLVGKVGFSPWTGLPWLFEGHAHVAARHDLVTLFVIISLVGAQDHNVPIWTGGPEPDFHISLQPDHGCIPVYAIRRHEDRLSARGERIFKVQLRLGRLRLSVNEPCRVMGQEGSTK